MKWVMLKVYTKIIRSLVINAKMKNLLLTKLNKGPFTRYARKLSIGFEIFIRKKWSKFFPK